MIKITKPTLSLGQPGSENTSSQRVQNIRSRWNIIENQAFDEHLNMKIHNPSFSEDAPVLVFVLCDVEKNVWTLQDSDTVRDDEWRKCKLRDLSRKL